MSQIIRWRLRCALRVSRSGRTRSTSKLLREEQSNEDPGILAAKANQIAKLLRAQVPARMLDCTDPDSDYDLIDVVVLMEECTGATLADELEDGVSPVEIVNDWLELLYDWADANRVWLGN